MQPALITISTIHMALVAPSYGYADEGSPMRRNESHPSGVQVDWKNVERHRGDYLATLEWLRERQCSLRHAGYRVRRTSFQARGSRWVSRIIYTR